MEGQLYQNRQEAAFDLSKLLNAYKESEDTLVLGLARGGIVIAHELARILSLDFDLILTRKIGAPDNPELAIGAIANENIVLNEELIKGLGISSEYLNKSLEEKKREAKKKLDLYRVGKEALSLKDKRVIIVDDGIATGSTMKAAILYVKSQNPKEVIVAIPVIPLQNVEEFKKLCDRLVAPLKPELMLAVGQFYREFDQVEDDQIMDLFEPPHT